MAAQGSGSERQAADSALLSAFENAPIGMAVLTPEGVITACNVAVGRLLGCPTDELLGGTFFDVTHADDMAGAIANCQQMQAGGNRILRHECRFLRADGAVVWVSISVSRVPDGPDGPAHLIMQIEDVDDRKNLEAELIHRAHHDPLTGLANRSLLTERIDAVLRTGTRPHCLLYLDLDGFKQVNDRYGHAAGDQVLQQLAGRMTALLRPGDTAARVGGDEFAILCLDADDHRGHAIAERLRVAAAQPFRLGGTSVRLTATVGISGTDRSAGRPASPAELVHRADQHMYAIKQGQRA
jgi:diguanylate cyclase (GGDEF)-like protein/PAS domain S-box-containing protein